MYKNFQILLWQMQSKSITSDLMLPTPPYCGHRSNYCRDCLMQHACSDCVIAVLQNHCYAFQINSAIICQESTRFKALLSGTFLHKVSVLESVQWEQTLPNSMCCVAIVRMQEANSSSSYFMDHLSLVVKRLKFLYISVGKSLFFLISSGVK